MNPSKSVVDSARTPAKIPNPANPFHRYRHKLSNVSETATPGDADPSGIVHTDDVLDGKPRVEGRRIGVDFLHAQVEGRGSDAVTVAEEYGLDVADVYRALAYYHDHPEEMARLERRRERIHAEAEDNPEVATGPEDLE
jgi:uncharacterized protein (DUF433 family)